VTAAEMDGVTFDRMQLSDAADVAVLAGQLGYPSTAEDIRARMSLFEREAGEQLRVARLDSKVVGWVHFQLHRSLATEPRVELANVVVDEKLRGRGIGARLVALAEEWGKAQGIRKIRLASRVTRPEAHKLYLRLGYTIEKTSHVFTKPL
jgi:GNAT superfamily N-acetyltransferase